MKLSLRMV